MYQQWLKFLDFKRRLQKSGTFWHLGKAGFYSQEGNALIEFGIIAPVMIFLLLGLFEIGFMLVIQNALDAAATQASRFGMTGEVTGKQNRNASITDTIFNTLNAYSGGMIDPSKVVISTIAYNSLSSAEPPLGTGRAGSFGTGGQTVVYTISYPWIIPFSLNGNKSVMLSGTAIVVDESF